MKLGLLVLLALFIGEAHSEMELIGGTVVDKALFPEIVMIRSSIGGCTATFVGPKVLITAAHCGKSGEQVKVFSKETLTGSFVPSPYYASRGHDVALVVLKEETKDLTPHTVGGTPRAGHMLTVFGYGCTQRDRTGMDGNLRTGKAQVTRVERVKLTTQGQSTLCPGDSGGPAFVRDGLGPLLTSINSSVIFDLRTNLITGPSQVIRIESNESRAFLKQVGDSYQVDVCGINANCARPSKP